MTLEEGISWHLKGLRERERIHSREKGYFDILDGRRVSQLITPLAANMIAQHWRKILPA